MDSRDALTKKYFNANVSVARAVPEFSICGIVLSDTDICRLSGAPDGSCISVSVSDFGFSMVVENRGIFQYPSEISLVRLSGADDQVMILDELIMLRSNALPAGFGLRMFAIQAHAAADMGISAIALEAAGSSASSIFNGYYTWPRYGFDAKIDQQLLRNLPETLTGAASVADLMESQEGRSWWLENGHESCMEFDLTPGSRSWQTLKRVMKEKGVRI